VQKNVLYRHKENSTVAFEVLKSFYVKEKKLYKVKVKWWNIGRCHEPWCMEITQKLEIPVTKLTEFEFMNILNGRLSDNEFQRLCVRILDKDLKDVKTGCTF
jgi:hypothetical protein